MDQEQAARLLAAAQKDYERATALYEHLVEGDPYMVTQFEELREVRADVLAAHEVLELAEREVAEVSQLKQTRTWVCDRCRAVGPAPYPHWARGLLLCDACYEVAERPKDPS